MALLRPPSAAEILEQRRASPRIIHSGLKEPQATDSEDIPFVPAYDLLEAQEKLLTDSEAACVALALYSVIPDSAPKISAWSLNARRESIYKD